MPRKAGLRGTLHRKAVVLLCCLCSRKDPKQGKAVLSFRRRFCAKVGQDFLGRAVFRILSIYIALSQSA